MVPNGVLEVDETTGRSELGRHACATEVVSLLRGRGMDWAKLVGGQEIVSGTAVEGNPSVGWFTTSPSGPVILGKGNEITHGRFVGFVVGNNSDWSRRWSSHFGLLGGSRHGLGEFLS
jgi:hypothetical protein